MGTSHILCILYHYSLSQAHTYLVVQLTWVNNAYMHMSIHLTEILFWFIHVDALHHLREVEDHPPSLHGLRPYTIAKVLEEEGIKVCRYGVYKFLVTYRETGSVQRQSGSGRLSKTTMQVKELVEEQMQKDDETTAYQLHHLLVENGIEISLKTVLRCRTTLGWTFRGSAYCQLIREANKVKRLQWSEQHKDDNFDDVIWTNEATTIRNSPAILLSKNWPSPEAKA